MSNENNQPDERADLPRYTEWMHLREHGQWSDGVPHWARDHTGRMNDFTAANAVIEELAARVAQQATKGDERVEMIQARFVFDADPETPDVPNYGEWIRISTEGAKHLKARYGDGVEVRELVVRANTPSPVAGSAGQAPTELSAAITEVADFLESAANLSVISQFTAITEWIDRAAAVQPIGEVYEHQDGTFRIGANYYGEAPAIGTKLYSAPTAPSLTTDAGAVLRQALFYLEGNLPDGPSDQNTKAATIAGIRALIATHPEQRMSDAARKAEIERGDES